jgi:hypothetical protein
MAKKKKPRVGSPYGQPTGPPIDLGIIGAGGLYSQPQGGYIPPDGGASQLTGRRSGSMPDLSGLQIDGSAPQVPQVDWAQVAQRRADMLRAQAQQKAKQVAAKLAETAKKRAADLAPGARRTGKNKPDPKGKPEEQASAVPPLAQASAALISQFQEQAGLEVTGVYDEALATRFRELRDRSASAKDQLTGFQAMSPALKRQLAQRQGLGRALNYYEKQGDPEFAAKQVANAAESRRYIQGLVKQLSGETAPKDKDVDAAIASGRAGGLAAQYSAGQERIKTNLGREEREVLEAALSVSDDKSVRKAIRELNRTTASTDDQVVIQAAANLRAAMKAGREQVRGQAGGLGAIGDAMEVIFEPIQRAYYAGKLAESRGLSFGDQLGAMADAPFGTGVFSGSQQAQRISDVVQTRASREVLREKGELASFGEYVSGKAEDVLKGKALERYKAGANFGLGMGPRVDALSAPLDLGFQVASDPTLGASMALKPLAAPLRFAGQEAAERAARTAAAQGLDEVGVAAARSSAFRGAAEKWLGGRTGQALTKSVDEALDALPNRDIGSLQRAFPGLPEGVAREVSEAGSKAKAMDAMRSAMVTGSWSPEIRPLATQARLGVGLGSRVGRTAVRPSQGLTGVLRRAARGSVAATVTSANVKKFADVAINSSLSVADKGTARFRDDFAAAVNVGSGKLSNRVSHILRRSRKDGDEALQAYVEQRLRPLLKDDELGFLRKGADWKDRTADRAIAGALRRGADSGAIREVTDEIDTVLAILDGKAGASAAEQMRLELSMGWRAEASDPIALAKAAAGNVGFKLPKKVSQTQVDTLLSEHTRFADELERLRNLEDARLEAQLRAGADAPRLGVGGMKGKLARGVLGVMESGPAQKLIMNYSESESVNIAHRVDVVERSARAFQLTDAQVAQLGRDAAAIRTEREMLDLTDRIVEMAARNQGVDPRIIDIVRADTRGRSRQIVTGIDQDTGEILEGAQTQAQLLEAVTLPDADALRRALHEELAKGGRLLSKMRVHVTALGDISLVGLSRHGKPITIRMTMEAGHRLWKLLIVTNLHLPLLGALAGAVAYAKGEDGPEAIAIGAAIGFTGPIRYIARVSGIEERMRYFLDRGFMPKEWIPGVSKWRAQRGIPADHRFGDYSAVRPGGYSGSEFEQRFLLSAERDWTVKEIGQAGYFEDWLRLVQHQVQPDTSFVDNILLGKKAGRIAPEEADILLAQLKDTDGGKLWLKRMKGASGGAKNWNDAVARTERHIDTYFTSPELADARLSGEVTLDMLKTATDKPRFVFGVQRGRLRATNLFRSYNELTTRGVFSGASSTISRNPLARWTYADNYDFFVRIGKTPDEAQELASEIAVRHTNDTMFLIDSESRFARKADFVFPFQQPREEFVRVWTKLVANAPMRAIRMTRLAMLALNNGRNIGMFREDSFGETVMTIPGSGMLSQALGGFNGHFDIKLTGLFMVGGGIYGDVPNVFGIPGPGGPYWGMASSVLVQEAPELFEEDSALGNWLLPYGANGDIFRPESRRLWAGMTGDPAPWSFLDPDMENEFNKWNIEVARSLYAKNIRDGKAPEDAFPTDAEVRAGLKGFFKTWALMGSLSPATPTAVFADQELYQKMRDQMTLNGTLPMDYERFKARYPEFAPYLTTTGEWTGPDDWETWSDPDGVANERMVGYTRNISFEEFKADFKQYERESRAYNERDNAFNMPAGVEREKALFKWAQDHPELAARSREVYFRNQDLAKILAGYPKGEMRDAALDRWRRQYDVKSYQMPRIIQDAKAFQPNPWREARATPQVVKEVTRRVRRGENEIEVVSRLNPAEQARYWDQKQVELDTNWNPYADPRTVMDQYDTYRKLKNSVISNNPILVTSYADKNNEFEKLIAAERANNKKTNDAIYGEIATVTAAMDAAAEGKRWSEYYALKDKQATLYDMARAVKNDLYQKYPDLSALYDDVAAATVFLEAGNVKKYQQLISQLEKKAAKGGPVKFVPTNEEAFYLSMPPNVRKSYVQTLIDGLNAPSLPRASGKQNDEFYDDLEVFKGFLKQRKAGALYWNNLTDFQRDLLERNLPADMVREWALTDYTTNAAQRAKVSRVPAELFADNPELAFAYELMARADTRGGVAAPKQLEEYLNLPNDPVVRADWLSRNPDVDSYLKAGGFLQLSEAEQFIVQNAMLKYAPVQNSGAGSNSSYRGFKRYGNRYRYGNDDGRQDELGFAFEQLKRWSRRPEGATAPATYEAWVNMPTGIDKAKYLEAHPEIKDWLSTGPMSNMPDEYQQVVRDIMQRYGYWTEREDPLSKVISEYYATPSYAKQKFLLDHPELAAYWSAIRSPEEQMEAALADQYFSIQDQGARKAFIAAHPELQQYFLNQRTKRYERFLNQVAMYMGQNPDLFDHYLNRQNDILNEMLQRWGTSPLFSERSTPPTPRGTAPAGRQRDTGPRRR